MDKTDRRKALKAFAVGSVWTAPVVSSVVLPVHAATSLVCTSDPITIDLDVSDDFAINDRVLINFDGEICSLVQQPGDLCIDGGCVPDTMFLIDNDADGIPPNFDLNEPVGSNWESFGSDEDNLSAGTYTRTKMRTGGVNAGTSYSVTFTVSFSGTGITVSNVSFVVAP